MGWRSASKGEMVGRLATLISMSWLVAGCVDISQSSIWELAGEPGLLLPVKQHYEFRAIEEEGRCKRPLFDAVIASEVIFETNDELVVWTRYRYRGEAVGRRRSDGDSRRCSGVDERTFRVLRDDTRYRVIGMTGERRSRGIAIPGFYPWSN